MEQFTKEITVGKEKRRFYFNRMRNANGVKFFITSHDDNNKAIAFSLTEKDKADWKLLPGSARWLYAIESQLSDAIVDTRL
ncbi:MAG TPA: hypothetical protein VEZ55_15045 [Chitinophagaceae bacterium]|jgi:hypothetical protein|nr:hypothetical protein [Chitinophagaceae bacterium]